MKTNLYKNLRFFLGLFLVILMFGIFLWRVSIDTEKTVVSEEAENIITDEVVKETKEYVGDLRVLLKGTGTSQWKESITVSSSEGFVIAYGEEMKEIAPKEEIELSAYFSKKVKQIRISPKNGGVLYLKEEEDFEAEVGYSGVFDVYKKQGEYCVVNECSLEEYLVGVVPSEMPDYYNMEALKAQAICARTYVLNHMKEIRYSDVGAHIDDTVNYQAYNRERPNERIYEAVSETAGLVVAQKDKLVNTYFFSTSCGMTGKLSVWNEEATDSYLRAATVTAKRRETDYSDNAKMLAFLKETPGGFDATYPYYRWCGTIRIDDRMKVYAEDYYYQGYQEKISVENKEGESISFSELLKVIGLGVTKRQSSGCVYELTIYCENGFIHIQTEGLVRKFMANYVTSVQKQDGSISSGYSSLPSAYFALEKQESGVYWVYGGGFGHGVGMSQNAANAMGEAGYDYEEILHYFYEDVEITKVNTEKEE